MDIVGSQITHTVSGDSKICANALTKSYTGDVAAHTSARTCVHVRPSVQVRVFPYVVVSCVSCVVVVCLPCVVCVSVSFPFAASSVSVISAVFADDVGAPTPRKVTVVFCLRLSVNVTVSVPLFFAMSSPVRVTLSVPPSFSFCVASVSLAAKKSSNSASFACLRQRERTADAQRRSCPPSSVQMYGNIQS